MPKTSIETLTKMRDAAISRVSVAPDAESAVRLCALVVAYSNELHNAQLAATSAELKDVLEDIEK